MKKEDVFYKVLTELYHIRMAEIYENSNNVGADTKELMNYIDNLRKQYKEAES